MCACAKNSLRTHLIFNIKEKFNGGSQFLPILQKLGILETDVMKTIDVMLKREYEYFQTNDIRTIITNIIAKYHLNIPYTHIQEISDIAHENIINAKQFEYQPFKKVKIYMKPEDKKLSIGIENSEINENTETLYRKKLVDQLKRYFADRAKITEANDDK
jgi:hypothetical protein